MAQNRIPETYVHLVHLGEAAAGGAAQWGAAIGLAQNTAAKVHADLVALAGDSSASPRVVGRQTEFSVAHAARTAANAARRRVEREAQDYVACAVGVLKRFLGGKWSSAWKPTGFTSGSLAVPEDPLLVLRTLAAYYAAHPEHAVAPLGQTPEGAVAQAEALSTARTAANAATMALGAAKQARDAAQVALYRRLCGLRQELGQVLGREDSRWYAFGFDRPADGQQPGPVVRLALAAGGPGIVLAGWGAARRAERYRVWRQVVGVDAAPVVVDLTVHDRELTVQGLPSGKEVRLSVAAVNAAGEGPVTVSAAWPVP